MASLSCPVCCDSFKDPRVLPCCHTFCTGCLRKLIEDSENASISCPLCRTEHQVPHNGANGFLEDFSIRHCGSESSVSEPAEHACDQCDEGDIAVSHCAACRAYLCDFCSQAHQRQNRYKDHSLSKVKSFPRAAFKHQCGRHNEPLKVYCQTCHCLVCCECIVGSHQLHTFKSINSETRAEVEEEACKLVQLVQESYQDVRDKIEYINHVEKSVMSQAEGLRKKIESAYQKLLIKLNASRDKCLNKIEEATTKNLKVIWADKNSAELKSKWLHATLELASRTKVCTDIEMLQLSGQLIQTIGGKPVRSMSFQVDSIESIDCTSLHFKSNNLDFALGSVSAVRKRTTTEFSMHVLEKLQNAPLGSECSFSIQFLTKYNNEVPKGYQFPVVSPADVSICYGNSKKRMLTEKIHVERTDHITRKIKFVPICSGVHDVTISVSSSQDLEPANFCFSVYGRPPLRAVVQRGPDWDTKRYQRSYDGGAGNKGFVMSCFYETAGGHKQMVLIDWTDGRFGHPCRWGSDGSYDIELLLT